MGASLTLYSSHVWGDENLCRVDRWPVVQVPSYVPMHSRFSYETALFHSYVKLHRFPCLVVIG